jgi:glyoxylase-like metal-dependent hydrolase (beta-lactamase superfamily II)
MSIRRRFQAAQAAAIALLAYACTSAAEKPTINVQKFAACASEAELSEPNPAYPWTPNAIKLVSRELSPGVFAVYDADAEEKGPAGYPSATSGGFIIGTNGVLLVETMINRQLFCQLIGLVREQTDLPILCAVNTSHHGDHSYGNIFLPDEVQIVQHMRTVEFITNAESFAGDIEFMEMNFGKDQGIDEIRAVRADVVVSDEGWSVDLGGRVVHARYLGFGQTEGDLFVHVPDADVLFTGNPFIARAPAIPWLLDGHASEVRETLARVRKDFPNATIVPGHDLPVSASELEFSLDYLDTLLAEVEAQSERGATLDETVAAVTMERFQGYALWGWVHSAVNVPATYEELSK